MKSFSQFTTLSNHFEWAAPATLKTNLFMRDLWKENRTWDEELPKQKKEKWNTMAADLANATTFVRPRYIPYTEKNCMDIIVDNSLAAYAAAAYHNGELYMAKTRLSSLSQKTILEVDLMAMARLTARKISTTNSSTTAHCGRNMILKRFSSLPRVAQINQDTNDFCSQPSEHDQNVQR